MSSYRKSDARVKAVIASLATVAALATLVVWRPPGILSVVLALTCVVLGMIAGVTITTVRQSGGAGEPPPAETWPRPDPGHGYGVDADTLEAIDPRAVRNLRTPAAHPVDADTLETLDPRSVRQQQRAGNGLSDR
ncbi:hypothetical protein O7602_00280 [Micromonospora sp. WMMD1128]|uniref:hypothetical protein n=1 Tax=unclassified Micromonospora TaxID=2617518 RepID=UPI00248BE1BD|nr:MULTISPECIES: hypothetical protein [unclassified Micromonospora]WBB74043.1 hypothetical protein O7602_00280 [Micromonospora sp. WMMD1128]WFE32569.1 hypothetical protein O7613_23815 [Micromonospora sp. WMMD975]